jgi:plastocyanin
MRRTLSIAGLAAALVLGIGLTPMGPKSLVVNAQQNTSTSEVKIDNFSFSPAVLTVPAGTTVTWTNRDDIPHTVVSSDDPKAFKSKVLDTDEKLPSNERSAVRKDALNQANAHTVSQQVRLCQ